MSSTRFEFRNYTTMTIGSWSEANKLGNGRFVKSDRFNVGGHSWRVAFYPHGRLVGTTASMSLFLLLDDYDNAQGGRTAADDEDFVHVKFMFMMHEVYERSAVFMSGTVAAAFSRRWRCNAHGFERFVSRDDFEKTALFKKDRFEIQCRLTVFPPATSKRPTVQTSRSGRPDPPVVQAPPPPRASPKPSVVPSAPPPTPTPSVARARVPPPAASPKPSVVTAAPPPASPAPSVAMSSAPPTSVQPESLVAAVSEPLASVPAGQRSGAPVPLSAGLPADLGRLLATKQWADVNFEVCGKVFAAHKSVLAARSPVFMEDFFGPAKEEDTAYVVIVPDMRPEVFEALLHYLYTDTLPPAMATMNSPEQGTVMLLAEDLLAAADRYELKDLKLLAEKKMCNHVGVSTVLPMLALAERHQCLKLKKMCLGFIGSRGNARAVMAADGLEILTRSSRSVIKDVISEILDAREARRMAVINALYFILPILLVSVWILSSF